MSFLEKFKKSVGIEILGEGPVHKQSKDYKPKGKRIEVKSEEKHKQKKPSQKEQEWKNKEKWLEPEGQLTVDVYQTDKELIIQSAVAGVKPEDLDISIESDMLLIRGNREEPEEHKGKRNYFHQECYWGLFSREIILPVEVDPSRIKAVIKEGVLTLRMPKIKREKKRKILVKEN